LENLLHVLLIMVQQKQKLETFRYLPVQNLLQSVPLLVISNLYVIIMQNFIKVHLLLCFPCVLIHIYLLSVFVFSQFPQQWKNLNLLFSILGRDRDYRDDNSIFNIWVHIQEKPATINSNNEQWTHFNHRYKTADINISLCSKWWSKFANQII
jgi:hypothetical protein